MQVGTTAAIVPGAKSDNVMLLLTRVLYVYATLCQGTGYWLFRMQRAVQVNNHFRIFFGIRIGYLEILFFGSMKFHEGFHVCSFLKFELYFISGRVV